MQSLGAQLESLQGRICLMCVGHPDAGDDALGVLLGEELVGQGMPDVFIAADDPEKFVFRGAGDGYDHLIFVDAVDFGAAPGSVAFLNAQQMTSRFPQVSTHRLSLGLLAQWIEARGTTKAWLLGVQVESLQGRHELSPPLRATMAALGDLLKRRLNSGASAC